MKRRISSGIPGAVRRRFLITAGALVAAAMLYFGICYKVVSSSLDPMPPPCPAPDPSGSGLVVEEVSFVSAMDQVPLVGWLLASSGDRAIVLVHGVDSHGWDGSHPDIARAYVEAGFHVLVFDLRGHGRSGGSQLGLGWHERRDVRAAVDLLLGRGFKPGRIGLHGSSYGAATALLAAAFIPEIGAVVADSAFADVREVMDREIEKRTKLSARFVRLLRPGLALVADHLFGLDFDTISPEHAVLDIAPRPILFIHGRKDAVTPVENAYRFEAASRNPVNELWIHRLGHTEGVRLQGKPCETLEPSPLREAFLGKVTAFFDHALR